MKLLNILATWFVVTLVLSVPTGIGVRIYDLCHETVADVVGQQGLLRWTDAKYVATNPDGSATIAMNAPVSQWPKACRLRTDETGALEIVLYRPTPDPIKFSKVILN